jgi:hypothetical protein
MHRAQVLDKARVEDGAIVQDDAMMRDTSRCYGHMGGVTRLIGFQVVEKDQYAFS